jgi:hypothetical protein
MTLGSSFHTRVQVGLHRAVRALAPASFLIGTALLLGCDLHFELPAFPDAAAALPAYEGEREQGDPAPDAGWGVVPAPPDAAAATTTDLDAAHDASPTASPDQEASLDAGRDAASPQEPLPASCSRPCSGTQPVCHPRLGLCVTCVEDVHCANGGHCDELGDCWRCVENTDCPAPSASLCRRGQQGPACATCEQDDDCAHVPGKPYCGSRGCAECEWTTEAQDCGGSTPRCNSQGSCVACTPATEAQDCGPNSCDRATFECTTTPRGSQAHCEPCQADSECGAGLGCVEQVLTQGAGEVSNGTFCFHNVGTKDSCADSVPARRPYGRQTVTTSVDGELSLFCLPATSCQALADAAGAKRCASDADCGVAGIADGQCLDHGPSRAHCTFACNHTHECPASGLPICMGSPGVCSP